MMNLILRILQCVPINMRRHKSTISTNETVSRCEQRRKFEILSLKFGWPELVFIFQGRVIINLIAWIDVLKWRYEPSQKEVKRQLHERFLFQALYSKSSQLEVDSNTYSQIPQISTFRSIIFFLVDLTFLLIHQSKSITEFFFLFSLEIII